MKRTGSPTEGLKFYLIGSATYSSSPRDIDLVIVYNPQNIGIKDLIVYRDQLKVEGLDVFGIPFDICLLSSQEVVSNSFLADEKAILLHG